MDARHVAAASLIGVLGGIAGLGAPALAIDGAEVELFGDAIARSDGAPAVDGYEPIGSPDLISSNDSEDPLGPHEQHEDAEFTQERLYRNAERVNADRSRGGSGTRAAKSKPAIRSPS